MSQSAIGFVRPPDDQLPAPIIDFRQEVPQPNDDEIVIQAAYSSVNPVDWKRPKFGWWSKPGDKIALGPDVAGEVYKKGKNVTEFEVGDTVVAYAYLTGRFGAWHEDKAGGYALAHKDCTAKLRPNTSRKDLGCYPVAFTSAYDALKPNMKQDDIVYIPGAGGGVAHFAIQLALKGLGAKKVISSAHRATSAQLAEQLGAEVFDYKAVDNPSDEVKKLTDGKGADIVFDSIWNPELYAESARAVKEGGILVLLDPNYPSADSEVVKVATERSVKIVLADTIRYFLPESEYFKKKAWLGQALNAGVALWHSGAVKPHIAQTFDTTLDDIKAALVMKEKSSPPGKISIRCRKITDEEKRPCPFDS